MGIYQLNELDDTIKDNIVRVLWMSKFDANRIPEMFLNVF